jgi:hypothetical protein
MHRRRLLAQPTSALGHLPRAAGSFAGRQRLGGVAGHDLIKVS